MPLLHPVIDHDPKFFINSTTRAITTTGKDKIILVKGDRNSESYTFAVPRMIEGHDMINCNKVRVHFINTDAVTMDTSPGIFELDGPLEEYEFEGAQYVTFTWVIDSAATTYAGKLAFAVECACFDGANKVYSWNTLPYSNITVSDGINNVTVVEAQYKDILQDWYDKIYGSAELPIKFVTQAEYDALGDKYEPNTLYMIADDQTFESFKHEMRTLVNDLDDKLNALDESHITVKDSFDGGTTYDALSANRGKELNDRLAAVEGAGYITRDELDTVPDFTDKKYITQDDLDINQYITQGDLDRNQYITQADLDNNEYVTRDDLKDIGYGEETDPSVSDEKFVTEHIDISDKFNVTFEAVVPLDPGSTYVFTIVPRGYGSSPDGVMTDYLYDNPPMLTLTLHMYDKNNINNTRLVYSTASHFVADYTYMGSNGTLHEPQIAFIRYDMQTTTLRFLTFLPNDEVNAQYRSLIPSYVSYRKISEDDV